MPVELTITIPNLPQMKWAFSQDLTPEIATTLGSELVPQLLAKLRDEAPRKTGQLADTLSSRPEGALAWGFYENVPYGIYPREGTPPHPIDPHRPPYGLWWPDMRVGHPVGHVDHPGQEKNPYHLRALEGMIPAFEAVMGKLLYRIGERLKF